MSRYTVVWWPAALDELATLWLDADDRSGITADADEIDRRLAEQASEWGNDVTVDLRLMELSKMRAYFRISELDRRVEVVSVIAKTPPNREATDNGE